MTNQNKKMYNMGMGIRFCDGICLNVPEGRGRECPRRRGDTPWPEQTEPRTPQAQAEDQTPSTLICNRSRPCAPPDHEHSPQTRALTLSSSAQAPIWGLWRAGRRIRWGERWWRRRRGRRLCTRSGSERGECHRGGSLWRMRASPLEGEKVVELEMGRVGDREVWVLSLREVGGGVERGGWGGEWRGWYVALCME